MKAFVTGGAGFIGSHIVDRLLADGHAVTVYDNFRTGQMPFVEAAAANPRFSLVRGDILDEKTLTREMAGADIVFHLAANADVRGGMADTKVDFEQNTTGTRCVLEAVRLNGVKKLAFASSATVYGEPAVFPTPENVALTQTSLYGASKLCGEAMIQAYSEYYGITSWIFRFVSWIGERYTHGVIFDFMRKLRANPRELEVLGNGLQKKSYLYVKDGVDGIMHAVAHFGGKSNVFNLGNEDHMNVLDLARIITDRMGLKDVEFRCTGGERGWVGDSPFVHLDVTKLKESGWSPRTDIATGIRKTVDYLAANPGLFEKRQ